MEGFKGRKFFAREPSGRPAARRRFAAAGGGSAQVSLFGFVD